MFDNISIMGRAAYGFYALEQYIKEIGVYTEDWDILFEKLWSFPQFDYVDEYTYMITECLPDCIMECEGFSENGDWEYITKDEFMSFRSLYESCAELKNISAILNAVQEMLSNHLYQENCPPAQASLEIMNDRLYPLLKKLLKQIPPIEPFQIYSVQDERSWGIFHSKGNLLKEINYY